MYKPVSTSRSLKSLLFFVAVIFVLAALARSQTTLATLEGKVIDKEGAGLAGASVAVRNEASGYSHNTVTRSDGSYIISGIEPGKYTLSATLAGFAKYERIGLTFNVGSRLKIDCTLSLATIEKEVIVTADAPMVEVTKSEISSVVTREQIDDLPLLSRNWTDLATIKAGVQGTTILDVDLKSNALPIGMEESMIDGVSNENIFMNAYRMSIPADAIQEFRVMTNLFSAEYGNTAGMVRSAITRSGTNQLRGRLAFFLRDEILDTPNYFSNHTGYQGQKIADAKVPNYEHYNFSGFVGGPIKKDRAHFFLSYEGLVRNLYSTITSPLVRRESIKLPDTEHNVFLKLSYQPSERNLFSFTTAYKRVSIENYYIGGLITKERAINVIDNRLDLQFHWNFFPSQNSMNEFRALYAYNGYDVVVSDPAFANTYAIDRPSGYFGKGAEFPQIGRGRRLEIADSLSLFFGNHDLKIGLDYHHAPGNGEISLYNPGQLIFATDDPFDPSNPLTYPQVFINNIGAKTFEWPQTLASLFIQDAWRVDQRLTLNYGLRYNYYTLSKLDIRKFNFPSNINPRFGFSWDPVGDGKTAIRGVIGAYTSNFMGNAAFDVSYFSQIQLRVILFPNYPDPNAPNQWWPFWESVLGLPPGYLAGQGQAQALASYKVMKGQAAPYAVQSSLGVQREILKDLSLGVDFVYTRGHHLLRKENSNPVIPGTGGLRVDPTQGDILMVTDGGRSEFKGAYFNLSKRYSRGWALDIAYTLGWSKTDTEYINTVDNYESNGWARQYGYSDSDARHVVSASGIFDVPLGFQLSTIIYYRSALPWNALYGYDRNLDSLLTDYIDQQRNSRRGLDQFYINARISKFFRISRLNFQVFAEAYNITNRANFYQISNNQQSPDFSKPTAALDPRLIQLGVRFDF